MTTETIKFRSMKQASAAVAERGLTPEQFGIEKVATANYVLTITIVEEPSEDEIESNRVANLSDAERSAEAGNPMTDAPEAKKRTTRVNRHYNDDGSLTLYVKGIKMRRIGGEENEDASEEEIEDPEAFAERALNRRFPRRSGGWVWGRTTQGHNWHTKKLKRLRAEIAELEAAGTDATEKRAELERLTSK